MSAPVDVDWTGLTVLALEARERSAARTRVGAAVLTASGAVHAAPNLEHRFRCHDIHAEVAALVAMAAAGDGPAVAVLVASADGWTPCGSCLDWIFELSIPGVWIAMHGATAGTWDLTTAERLMPRYPRRRG